MTPERCPVCRDYTYPAELADVAVARHAPTHTVQQWADVVADRRRHISDEEARHTERMTAVNADYDVDEDAPLRVVLEAADRAAPRIRRVDNNLAMVHARYHHPTSGYQPTRIDATHARDTER